jgi:hypothetical protein
MLVPPARPMRRSNCLLVEPDWNLSIISIAFVNCGIICAAERVTQRGYHFLPGMLHQTCARLHEIGMRRACAALGQDGGANLWAGALKPVDA